MTFCTLILMQSITQFSCLLTGSNNGRSSDASGFNFLDELSIPDSLIPPEFKFIKDGLCGEGQKTRRCKCEEGALEQNLNFPQNRDSVTFKDIKRIFSRCRPV